MLFAFKFFLVGKFLAGRYDTVLRLDMRRIRTTKFMVRFASGSPAKPAPRLADLQAGRKSLEISLLLVSKVGWWGFDIHALRRSSCGYLR